MSVRAFFAVDLLNKELVKKVVTIQKELELPETRINFVPPENFHLTLKFLGNLDEKIIPELPRAPIMLASAIDIIVSINCDPAEENSIMAWQVDDKLSPVSPSATGNTLISLMNCL